MDFTKSKDSGTFPATLQGTLGPRSRVVIPLRFVIKFFHDSFAVRPSGVTAPMPVTTTRRIARSGIGEKERQIESSKCNYLQDKDYYGS